MSDQEEIYRRFLLEAIVILKYTVASQNAIIENQRTTIESLKEVLRLRGIPWES